ncbi:MAG: hypothetical protein J5676_04805 [Bacteroidaceae bacterium]|nr:hypothetical protein [Bacteroidaceae bacterium]
MNKILKSSSKLAKIVVMILAVSLFLSVFVSCKDEEEEREFPIILFNEVYDDYNIHLGNKKAESIIFRISSSYDGHDIDLSQCGDWDIFGNVITGSGDKDAPDLLDSGSTLYVRKTGKNRKTGLNTFEMRYTLKKTIDGTQKIVEGSYSGDVVAGQK